MEAKHDLHGAISMGAEKDSPETIRGRIDAMIQELQELRRKLAVPLEVAPPASNLARELYGAPAPATGGDDGYDPNLDWERFG
jgi:hypothetical protein